MIQSVLNSIHVYWMILTLIPKGVLKWLRNIFFNSLWRRKTKRGIHWKACRSIAKPKEDEDWGLKELFKFGRAVAAKSV